MLEELVNKLEKDIYCELSKEEIKLLYGIDCKFDDRFKYCLSYRNIYEDLLKVFDKKLIAKTQKDINENIVVCLSDITIDKSIPTYNLKYIFGNLFYELKNINNLENLEVVYGDFRLTKISSYDGLDNLRDVLGFIEICSLNNNLDLSDIEFETNFLFEIYYGNYELVYPNKVKSILINNLNNSSKCKLPEDLDYLKIENVECIRDFKFPKNLKYLFLRLDDIYNKKQRIADMINRYGDDAWITADDIDIDIDNTKVIKDIVLNDNLKKLELYIEKFKGINLPKNLVSLYLPITSIIDNIELPDSLKELSLPKLKNISNLVLPDGLEKLLIHNVDTLDNVKLPSNLKVIDVANLSILKNIELKDDIKIYVFGELVTKEDIKQKYLI